MRRHFYWIILFLTAAFLFTRLYRIDTGYFFFNDAGRDLMVLEEWVDTLVPPLLGPQNSALPFNQPAIYFYWLMPLYVLSGFSLWSPLATLLLTVLVALAVTLWTHRADKRWWWVALAMFWLGVIHPEYIIQNRFVWNPSFVAAFLTVGLLAWLSLRQSWNRWALAVAALSLALAFSFSYSVVAVLMGIVLLTMWLWRRDWRKAGSLVAALTGSVLLFQLPTAVFELRYRGQLTKAVLNGTDLSSTGTSLATKTHDALNALIGFGFSPAAQWAVLVVLALALAANLWLIWKRPRYWADSAFLISLVLFIFVTTFMMLVPIALHTHYVFGITTTAFLTLALLRPRLVVAVASFLTVLWLQPTAWQEYFQPAPRSVEQVMTCARQVCSGESEPLYVSLETNRFAFMHAGPEFRYALKRSGCTIYPIETQPTAARHMAVVQDDGRYTHGQTAYYELTLFGPSQVVRQYQCGPKLDVTILERTP